MSNNWEVGNNLPNLRSKEPVISDDRLTGPNGHDFQELAQCLRQFHGTEIIFVPNPGNAGDALINLGMYDLFNRLGVTYIIGSPDGHYENRIVIYSGGGALVEQYPGSETFFHRTHKNCKAMVILPHTIRTHADLLAEMDERCFIFTREKRSYEYVKTHKTRAQLFQAHDLAFFLDDRKIANLAWSWPYLTDPVRRGAWARMVLKFAALAKLRDPVLHSFRTDIEATDIDIPKLNYDMSQMFSSGDMSFESCATTIKTLRSVMKRFTQVETNRLHIAVLAAIIGQRITMWDNSYGKNRDIYEHSIKEYFSNVTFKTTL